MALSDKNIVIIPSIGASTGTNPRILFTGGDVTSSATITLSVFNSENQGTLSFSGNSGQLFSITDSMAGTIFSVNDISGIPSIEVLDTGLVKLAQYNGAVAISTSTAISGYELTVFGGSSLNGNNQITGVTTVTNTTSASSTVTGALQVAGGVGIQGDVYARNIFSNGSLVVTAASLGTYGVSTLSAGTGTAVSSNTGTVTVWVTATLATITANGSTTTATITAANIFEPFIVDSITQQFDGTQAVFDLRVDQQYINSIVDSKDAEVILNGEQLYPYVDEIRWPWHTPYDSFNGFRIVNGVSTSSSVQLIIYNAPYIGDSALVTIRTRSTTRKKRKYPFSPATIALGD